MSEQAKHILLIEDDQKLAALLVEHLEERGFVVKTAAEGKLGYEEATANDYQLVILDWMLPDVEGKDLCKQLRAHDPLLPIIMLTSRSEELDKVAGLRLHYQAVSVGRSGGSH